MKQSFEAMLGRVVLLLALLWLLYFLVSDL